MLKDFIKAPVCFLGGTCNESKWRDDIIKHLKIDYFNPVVDDWNEEAYIEELKQREECDYVLYVITPKMTGVYSIAECIEDAIKRPEKTLFMFKKNDENKNFDAGQLKSLEAVGKMVEKNGGKWFKDKLKLVTFLNGDM